MILNRNGATFEYEGTVYTVGGPIIGTPKSEYAGLYGTIFEIRDGRDKETENDTPDLYCSFEPPVLPCEVEKLEKTFSDLYQQPKTIDDIALDFVIMAPEMVEPLDDTKTDRKQQQIFLLLEECIDDGEHMTTSEAYAEYEDAKRAMVKHVKKWMEDGGTEMLQGAGIKVSSLPVLYECYADYLNSYRIEIAPQPLILSSRFIRETADIYEAGCAAEDFASILRGEAFPRQEMSEFEGVDAIPKDRYQKMLHDPRFSEKISKNLKNDDTYWECYWEAAKKAAQSVIKEYLDGEGKGKA